MVATQPRPTQILIVEDSPDIREVTAEICHCAGLSTALACNGEEALRFLADHPAPRVILLDLMMPVMDGTEFRRRQLALPELARIPVVVLTAAITRPAREFAGVPMLRKPIEIDTLLDTLRRYC